MITKFDNFFTEDTLNLIDEKIKSIYNTSKERPMFSSSISHWDDYLKGSSTPILRYVLSTDDLELMDILKKEIQNKIPYYVNNVIIHICPKLSYIPWHNDSGHTAALTVYINKNWDPNWGGYFMYKDNDDIKALKPERNCAILQKGGLSHCVSTTNIDADYRVSIQCFLQTEKKLM